MEQEIKKYDEILKRNRNIRQQYELNKKRANKIYQSNENTSQLHNNSQISASGGGLIGIYGVKLDNKNLDVRRGPRGHNESSVLLEPKLNKYKLPSLVKVTSQQKGVLAKQLKLR